MNKFLFITHLTPTAKRSAFRQALIDVYFSALNNQTYSNWEVMIIGDEEKVDGKFHYFLLEDGSKESRFEAISKLFENQEVKNLLDGSDYIIKLDDDDIISPTLLNHLEDFNGDLYFDRFHTFIDSSSGVISQQERGWVASTCVHKKEHILSKWSGVGASAVGNLLYTDHSKTWHLYYESKNKVESPKSSPIYLRVLSPTSITSGALNGPPQSFKEVSIENYDNYLSGFGNWKPLSIPIFDPYRIAIARAWKSFSGEQQRNLPLKIRKNYFIKKMFGKR